MNKHSNSDIWKTKNLVQQNETNIDALIKNFNILQEQVNDLHQSYIDNQSEIISLQSALNIFKGQVNNVLMQPSDTRITLSVFTTSAGTQSTIAPANGWFEYYITNGSSSNMIKVENTTALFSSSQSVSANKDFGTFIPVRANDKIEVYKANSVANIWAARFIYAKTII